MYVKWTSPFFQNFLDLVHKSDETGFLYYRFDDVMSKIGKELNEISSQRRESVKEINTSLVYDDEKEADKTLIDDDQKVIAYAILK